MHKKSGPPQGVFVPWWQEDLLIKDWYGRLGQEGFLEMVEFKSTDAEGKFGIHADAHATLKRAMKRHKKRCWTCNRTVYREPGSKHPARTRA